MEGRRARIRCVFLCFIVIQALFQLSSLQNTNSTILQSLNTITITHHQEQQSVGRSLRASPQDDLPASTTTSSISNSQRRDDDTKPNTSSLHRLLSKRHYDVCVVGAGLSGAVIAERYANLLDQTVLVLEKRPHIGGNCFDFMDPEVHLRVSQYGAHLFHTRHERVWDYVQAFAQWTPYEHQVLGLVDNKYVPIPVNIHTVNILLGMNITSETEMDAWLKSEQVQYDHAPQNAEEVALSRVGQRLYEKIFRPYTQKQWARDPSSLGPEVTQRIPVRNNFDGRYFSDPHQALPREGYTNMFEHMLANNARVDVHTEVDHFEVREALNCTRTYYTGPIDAYWAHLGWETLQYQTIDLSTQSGSIQRRHLKKDFVVNLSYAEANLGRIVEFKHFAKSIDIQ